uniref:Uncharacterized mitochondrial protein AtMg00810-like n=1 Tax=Nicotiana tabacum TaxID=4097 RepID=A0A1S3ZTR3_TOBAC|nr:PREDICTED: uncharacterized mitochondrial protein AtMg00810-like [Nicotiana tabacum]
MTTIRTIIVVAVKKGWPMYQLDVNNAFLHVDLDEKVYMRIPQGLNVSAPTMVCKLDKCLYGLKQASRQWYSKLSDSLISKGYSVSKNDYSLFIKSIGSHITIVVVYVDDILLSGNDEKEMSSLKLFLDAQFKIKNLGHLHYFLGLEILSESGGVIICQRKFALDLLSEFNCLDCNVVASPLDVNLKLSIEDGEPLSDLFLYRKLIGKLNFLTNTRPDLAFSVQLLSQFMHAPTSSHLSAAYHVLKYVKGTLGQGLFMSVASDFSLHAYCDSDWASFPSSRRSVSGYLVLLGGSLLTWKSKKQHTVSLSSVEAEYHSMRRVVAELAWLTRLLHELSVTSIFPVPLHCDSQSAIYIARNPLFHERTKHIKLDCHFVREKLQDGLISLSYLPSKLQLADMLTKSLSGVTLRLQSEYKLLGANCKEKAGQ